MGLNQRFVKYFLCEITMYRFFDETNFFIFLSKEESDLAINLMKKGRDGTLSQKESDKLDELIDKNEKIQDETISQEEQMKLAKKAHEIFKNIKWIYLDMDGTLVDFVSQVNKCGFWRKDKENKVDWKKVKAMGPRFWSEMDWMPGAEEALKKLEELEEQDKIILMILSSIDFDDGREGKMQWISQKTKLSTAQVIFCQEPEDKAKWAKKDAWLIDDRKKSLVPFAAAGGNIIEFTGDWNSVLEKIYSIID